MCFACFQPSNTHVFTCFYLLLQTKYMFRTTIHRILQGTGTIVFNLFTFSKFEKTTLNSSEHINVHVLRQAPCLPLTL